MSDTLTIVIKLPQPVDSVVKLLRTIHEIWPNATLDVSGEWVIEVPADE